jgi:flavin reductase (DIM6/NTAB) family NADH-FMN oxidoreductase RutF
VVRRFVKPVTDVERADDGSLSLMSGRPVREVGPARLPILEAAIGYVVCTPTTPHELGSHTLFIGEVSEVGGEPADVLRMEDTRMHYGG